MKKFDPKPGDIIVCNNGDKYICIRRDEYPYIEDYPEGVIYAVRDINYPSLDHINWDNHEGVGYNNTELSISHIIPRVSSKAHKHADLIKQWADNKDLKFEFRRPEVETWTDCVTAPNWSENLEYRIKPEPKPDYNFYTIVEHDEMYRLHLSFTDNSKNKGHNIKLTFDGETGKLKSAEVI